nr:EOG090X06SP [Ilyocryptus agilis]
MGTRGTYAILGGGISGLTAAYRLTQIQPTPKRIVLLEASSRIGGWIYSERSEDGVVYECGPRTFRPVGESGITTLNLVEELGLRDQVLHVPYGHPSSTNRLIYTNSKLHKLPTSIAALFKTCPPFRRPLLSAAFRDLLTSKSREKDESMFDFVYRRFGPDLAELAIDPLVRGVCAGDSKEVSINFLLKSLKDYEQKYGRVAFGIIAEAFRKKSPSSQPVSDLAKQSQREKWPLWTLQGGLQSLPEALAEKAAKNGVELFVESPVNELEFQKDGSVIVKCREGELHASKVISALPSFQLAKLVAKSHPELSSLLEPINFVTVGLVNLEWPDQRLTESAFGFLVPSTQKSSLLGAVYNTCSFPQGDRTILTCMMGGRWFQSLFGDHVTEKQLLEIASKEIESILGISDPPSRFSAHILRQCIPQYVIGHYDRVKQIRQCIAHNNLNVDLIGASFDGVSVNDCIHNAWVAVDRLAVKT